MRLSKTSKSFLLIGLVSTLWSGCSSEKKENSKSKQADAALGVYDPATGGMKIIDPRPKVSAFSLDEIQFQTVGVRVGLQDYMSSQSPAISFIRPELADYVQVLRCTKEAIISVNGNFLENVQLGTSQTSEQTKIMQSNDFWSAAEQTNGCVLIATEYADKQILIDGYAPSGGFRWIIRTCIAPARLVDTGALSNRNCTRQVSVSPVLEDFKNKRQETERLAIQEALRERDKMDGIGIAVYYQTVALNNALTECQALEDQRQASVTKKRAIGTIIGQGVGLAASFYSAGSGAALDKTFSWAQAAKGAWKAGSAAGVGSFGAGLGSGLGAAINDLFTSSSDYPKSCSTAKKIENDGAILAQQLKAAHELFAAKMDQAEIARNNRVSLENQ